MSKQIDIFSDFYGLESDKQEGTNLFSAWDFFSIYMSSRREQTKLRKTNPSLPILKINTTLAGQEHSIQITPAIIETKDGRKEFYPSEREELVEQALRKMLLEQAEVINDLNQTWVWYTLKSLRKELVSMGHTMPTPAIKESLAIMSGCKLSITQNNQKAYSGSILIELIFTDRNEYEKTGKSKCAARFNSLITKSIANGQYRQMNYRLYMQSSRSVTRWLYKHIVNNFRNAGYDSPPFKISGNDVISSCRLNHARTRDSWAEIRKAFEELKDMTVEGLPAVVEKDNLSLQLLGIKENKIKKGSKIVDIIFEIRPSRRFISFSKAANKREKESTLHLNS